MSLFYRRKDRGKERRPQRRRCLLEVTSLEDRSLEAVGTITATAVPRILAPNNGQIVPVTVSGTIFATRPGGPTAFFQVTDEYRRIEPKGHLVLHKVATDSYAYSFTIDLQAKASTRVLDGRHYDILVAAGDVDNGNGVTIAVHVLTNATTTPPKVASK
jgi:hypothetical protein